MIRLLSTDFDGTLVGWEDQGTRGCDALWDALGALRRDEGVLWAINTGRTLDFTLQGLDELDVPVRPDYLLTMERDIHRPDDAGRWVAFGGWNEACALAHARLFEEAADLLAEIVHSIERDGCATLIRQDNLPVGLVAADDDAMDRVLARIDAVRVRLPMLDYQRNRVWLRFSHAAYHKGSTLGELGRLLGLDRDQIFAVGDQHNDLSMLDGRHARHVACPSNSVDPVKNTVRAAAGHVAGRPYGEGVLEALRLHFPTVAPAPR